MNPRTLLGGHAPRLLLFVMLLCWCGALLVFRFARTGSLALGFMAWNLFLAAIPAVAAWFFARAMGKNSSLIERVGWFVIWLVFLPNAPYIITDFVHLNTHSGIPFWYDTALFVSCAGTGLLLGYTSIGCAVRNRATVFRAGGLVARGRRGSPLRIWYLPRTISALE